MADRATIKAGSTGTGGDRVEERGAPLVPKSTECYRDVNLILCRGAAVRHVTASLATVTHVLVASRGGHRV